MASIANWVQAFRLRTLPLAFSSILTGSFLAAAFADFKWSVLVLALLTTLFLQVLSNLANDYGDGVKGTDNADRIGPQRAIQSGAISPAAMKKGIIITAVLALISGIGLLYFGTRGLDARVFGIFLVLGLAAIAAAIAYTVGNRAYGYLGLGDLFVLLFFGLTGVGGTYFLHAHEWSPGVFLPALAIGFLSMAVLNLNNMRDREPDARVGKNTLAVRLGDYWSRAYHMLLLLAAVCCAVCFTLLNGGSIWQFIYLIILPPLISNVRIVATFTDPASLDPELKKVALTTFLFSLTFGLGLFI
ncbi:MAG: 1,4-dihydroxy-2-naphthoate polyprenyltransferase [Cryomorphaceae bacterium]|nr:MAG: 1,4-dihydroxy-2-naphthoate polyprenyltransferase [Cryomorphaceae bacterium]